MIQIKKTILTLVALLAVTTGAWADETPLTTITATGTEQASYSTANVATVSFSYTAGGSSAYLANWGWWGYGWIATVTAAEGYTITKCIFYDDANRTATDSEAPFVVETTEEDKTPRINGTPIDGGNMWSKGIKKIEVYGYVTPAASSGPEVAWNKAENSGSFTMPGGNVTLEPEYYPQAALATAPTAINDVPATTDGAIVNAGTVANIGETTTAQGTVMYYVSQTTGETAPEAPDYDTDGWSEDVPTANGLAQGKAYVWYYIKGAEPAQVTDRTDDNTRSDSDIKPLGTTGFVTIAAEPTYAVTFKAANANTIEAGKATVTVGGTAATVTEGKLEGVKMNSKVTIAVSEGYKIKSATAKQKEGETTVTVTVNEAKTEASFEMPTSDVDFSYELVRDMTVDVDATIADRIRIKKENNAYVVVTDGQLTPAVSDKISGTAVAMTATTDYTAQLQKKTEGDTPTWADATTLSVGTFRYVITGTGLYDGKITTNEFQLFEGYEVTIPAGEYATYFKDEALYVENENAQLYTISSVTESEAVLSDAITVAPANTPLLVYNKSEQDKIFLLIPTTDKTPDNVTAATQFVGTLEATTIPASATGADNYALNGYAFVWVKTAIPVAANKCWLHIASQPAGARGNTRSIAGGNGTTGIESIHNSQSTIDNEGWYDMQGRKLQAKPNRGGIYIHNGKKVIVR